MKILAITASAVLAASSAQAQEPSAPAPAEKADHEHVTVEGQRIFPESRVGILGNQTLHDTPCTVHTYDKDIIEKQQSMTANQVLKNDPAVTNVSTAGGFSAFTIGFRGFPVGADAVTFNGLGPGSIFSGSLGELYTVDRIEVVKGPSAALGSFSPSSSVGGAINIVSKAPTADPITHLGVGLREKSIYWGSADVSRTFGDDKQFGVRVNLAAEKGEAFHGGTDERNVGAVDFSYRLSKTMRFNLGYDSIHNRSDGYQNGYVLASGVAVPKAPNPMQNHFQSWSYLVQEWDFGYGSYQWDFADRWTFEVDGMYGTRRRPIFSTGTGLITNPNGAMTLRPSYLAGGTEYAPFEGVNAFIRGTERTGPVVHDLTFAALGSGYDFRNAITTSLAPIQTNLYNPVYVDKPDAQKLKTGRVNLLDTRTYAITDSMRLTKEWNLLIGAKNTTIHFENYDVATGRNTLNQNDTATTPVAAISYQPVEQVNTYASYVEGLERGGQAPVTAANANEIMPSIKSRQVEVGVKTRVAKDLFFTTALFQIERDLEYLDADSNVYTQDGLQRNRGVELSFNGDITSFLSLTGGAMYVDADVVRSGTTKDKQAPGVPHFTLPLLFDAKLGYGLSANLGFYHFSRQYVDAQNTRSLDPWTRVDGGLDYRLPGDAARTTISVNVENITDHRYWASAAQGQLALGGPEIWKFALRCDL